MKRAILSAVVILSLGVAKGQQDPQYSNFMYDKLSVNPGYAGIHGMYCGTVMYRNQWMGFEGSPKTVLFNLDGAVPAIHGGVGLTFYNDKLGFETNNIIRLAYSFHQPIAALKGTVGFGLSAGYASKAFQADWVYIQSGDTEIPNSNIKEGALDLNFGVYYKHAVEDLYVGISSTHLNGASLTDLNLDVARHYWFMTGYKYNFNSQWAASGDFITKSDLASTQFDLALRGWYMNKIYAGVSYRHQDAIFPMFGAQLDLSPTTGANKSKMYLTTGVAYDVTLSDIKNYSSGSMELFVKFCYKPVINPVLPKPFDVRFLGT